MKNIGLSLQFWKRWNLSSNNNRNLISQFQISIENHQIHQCCFQTRRSFTSSSLTSHRKSLCFTLKDGIKEIHRSLSTRHSILASYQTFESQPSSWLFVSNAAAGAYGAQVNVDLDMDARLAADSISLIQENITARGITFDVTTLTSLFKQLKILEQMQKSHDGRKFEILKLLKELEDKDVKDTLSTELHQNKKEMKNLTKSLWEVEEQVMKKTLQLPNDLHPDTPLKEVTVEREANKHKGYVAELTHVEIAEEYDLIKFSNVGPRAYYLKGEIAMSEIRLTDVANDYFHHHGYRLMSGPEFFKTPVMEGCGLDVHDTDKVLTLQHTSRDIEPMLHLAGISPMTFAAYLARLNIGNTSLPLRMFSIGRRYQTGMLPGLFGAPQSTQVGVFICVGREQANAEFDQMTETIWNYIESFGFHIRMCHIAARDLKREEKRRVEIHVFAPSLNDFVPIASISDLGDFVSRRLMTYHSDNHGDVRHGQLAHMISGTGMDITTLLAVWIEMSYNDASGKFTLKDLPPLRDWKKNKASSNISL